jgi:AraC-like DNA-binding protein
VTGERVTVTTCEIGFPIVTHSHVPKHQIVVAYMIQACQASRWCAVPLRPHTVMIYGPGAEHVAINQPGLAFTFGVTELDLLAELADQTNTHIKIPSTGSVQQFPISTTTRALGDALHNFTYTGFIDQPLKPARNRVLQSLVTLLATNQPQHHIGTARGVDSRDIVRECVEYATTTQRIPSLRELCTAAKVSERRLRTAFTDEFDRPPTRFFRDWALGQANRRLRQAHPNQLTVTEVAMELGFAHLGRFAGHYRHLYGEPPSTTLHNPTPLAG